MAEGERERGKGWGDGSEGRGERVEGEREWREEREVGREVAGG